MKNQNNSAMERNRTIVNTPGQTTQFYEGIIPALITPFRRDGKLDLEVLPPFIQFLLQAGCRGFYVGGSTGEGFMQTVKERIRFTRAVMAVVKGRVPVILHVGAMNPAEACCLAEAGGKLGVAAVSSVVPFYYIYDLDEITAYYRRIQEASGLPLILYYLPDNTNRVISIEQFRDHLLAIRGVIGLKYTHSDLNKMQMIVALSPQPITLFGGYDQMGICFLAMGAQALIGATHNMIPEMYVSLYRAFRQGRIDEARRKQEQINRFLYEVKKFGNRAYYAVLKIRGLDVGIPRRSSRELSKADWKSLEAQVKALKPEWERA